jgi:hypothetical protein
MIFRIAWLRSWVTRSDVDDAPAKTFGTMPPDAKSDRDAFFQYKSKTRDDEEEPTPLQRRMRSGGA